MERHLSGGLRFGHPASVRCAFGRSRWSLDLLGLVPWIAGRSARSSGAAAACSTISVEAKKLWAERRNIGKQHDSYQWQKLFWIGLGLLPYAVAGDGLRTGQLAMMLICLVGGGAGLLFWRRVDATRSVT
jgi:hypothetical protein